VELLSCYGYSHTGDIDDSFVLFKDPVNSIHKSNIYPGDDPEILSDPRKHSAAVANSLLLGSRQLDMLTMAYAHMRLRLSEGVCVPKRVDLKDQYKLYSTAVTTWEQNEAIIDKYAQIRGITHFQVHSIIQ